VDEVVVQYFAHVLGEVEVGKQLACALAVIIVTSTATVITVTTVCSQ
jgi:hypothetical protein